MKKIFKEKSKQYSKQYYQKHKKEIKQYKKQYYQKYKEKLIRCQKKHYIESNKILVSLKINGCAICGYNECTEALEFHHVNSQDKKFGLDMHGIRHNSFRVIEELNKCILLCANCHREIHVKERKK